MRRTGATEQEARPQEFGDADRHRPAGPRDTELERDLVRWITEAFVDAYRVPAETVQVWIHEVPADSWGAAGALTADEQPHRDVDRGRCGLLVVARNAPRSLTRAPPGRSSGYEPT
ncbi:4-oxalocrotonate tautomerase family protein [Streptomyces sp. NPDC101237]|uniref:tautomerase family protein n=1 Tax=Streptomyces sp. NPDC101237 TaxID=3366139 RepID=UPI003821E1CA